MSYRWFQLLAGVCAMIAVANFQYAWTQFIGPLEAAHPGWDRVAILDALNLFFIPAQTWLVPAEGYLAERIGPRRLLVAGAIFVAVAWVVNAATSSLAVLYAAQLLAGCGSGIVYGISMGSALKWFPDRRGLAAGLIAAAFGAGSALTVLPIKWTIAHHGYATAFLWFGCVQGGVILLAALCMRFPHPGEVPAPPRPHLLQTHRDYLPSEVICAPSFWLLYVMLIFGGVPGLLMLGQIVPMSGDFGIAGAPIYLFTFMIAAEDLAQMVDRSMGGLTRPFFGWLSDHIGRENAIGLAFTVEGVSLFCLLLYGSDPVIFVLASGMAFFGWGAVFSIFPAICGDMFGRLFATTNYGWLYTAKGVATLIVVLLNRVHAWSDSWTGVFVAMMICDLLASGLAVFVLKPLRLKNVKLMQPGVPDTAGTA